MTNQKKAVQCVRDVCVLRPPLSAGRDASLPLVAFYMNLMKVEAVAVVDEDDHCIGFVTGDDLIDPFYDNKIDGKEPCTADIMRPPNMSIYLDDHIEQALIVMNMHNLDWLPVINFDTQKFEGLICREDISPFPSNIMPFLKNKFFNKAQPEFMKRKIQ